MTEINTDYSLSGIMADIDLGPTGSVQMMFAKLQLAQSQICKNQAEDYMSQIEEIQDELKLGEHHLHAAGWAEVNIGHDSGKAVICINTSHTFYPNLLYR